MNPLDLEISRHAASRWMERSGFRDPEIAREKWNAAISIAEEAKLKENKRMRALLRHGCTEATYLCSGQWVFVVVNNTVVTVHTDTADLLDRPRHQTGKTEIPYMDDWTPPPNSQNLHKWCLIVDGKFKRSYKEMTTAEQAAGDIQRLTGASVALAIFKGHSS
jgi:hypothetical protein